MKIGQALGLVVVVVAALVILFIWHPWAQASSGWTNNTVTVGDVTLSCVDGTQPRVDNNQVFCGSKLIYTAPAGYSAAPTNGSVNNGNPAVTPTPGNTANPTAAPATTPVGANAPTEEKSRNGTAQNSLVNPLLFDAQSTGKGLTKSFDIGTNSPYQYAIIFGYSISWNNQKLDGGCALVRLAPGWYPNFTITDGRYEIYTVPSSDPDGWKKVLAEQEGHNQSRYGCKDKKLGDIPEWTSNLPSPLPPNK